MTSIPSTPREYGQPVELFIFARFHAREGQEAAVAAALRDVIRLSRGEAGCLTIAAYRSTSDERLFYIHSRWKDEAAFEIHAEMPHTKRFLERIQPLIDHKLDVTRTRPFEAAGGHTVKYFAVTRERGPAWNASLPMRGQKQWAEHAAFMDWLTEEGFVVIGGPIGDEAGPGFSSALLIVRADSERIIETRLEADPWTQMKILRTRVEPWEILLGKDRLDFPHSKTTLRC